MRVFVTGATGVLGRPVVQSLTNEGHTVQALCRSASNRAQLTAMGVTPQEVDLFNPSELAEVLVTCDTVLHLATSIPATNAMKKSGIWAQNDRLRRKGTRSIVAAAEAAGTIKTLLYPSVSFFYGDGGDSWLDASNAKTEPTSFLNSTLDAENSVGAFRDASDDRRGIVLRFGAFYGPASPDSLQVLDMARRGLFMPIAGPSAYKSMIWIDDAASAVIAALESARSGVYDVVEDQPSTQAEAAKALAAAVARPRLRHLPRWLLRLALPGELREVLGRSQRVSNTRFKEATGWSPAVPSQADGWRLMDSAVGETTMGHAA